MADSKISALPAATTPLAGTEVLPIVQSSTTKQVSVQNILSSIQPTGTANGVAYLNGSKVLTTGTALTFDGTNLGLAVTPESTWQWPVFQIQNSAFSGGASGDRMDLSYNFFRNGTAAQSQYISTNFASNYRQQSGQHSWLIAPSGTANSASITTGFNYVVTALGSSTLAQWQAFFSALVALPTVNQVIASTATGTLVGGGLVSQVIVFTQAMTLNTSGNLGIGTTSPSVKLEVKEAITNGYTPSFRITRTSASLNDQFFGFSNGVATDAQIGRIKNSDDLLFGFNNGTSFGEKMRLDSAGNLGLGGTPTTWTNGRAIEIYGVNYALLALRASNAGATWRDWAFASNYNNAGELNFIVGASQGATPSSVAMTLNSSGNLGLGVTPSAWGTGFRVMQVGLAGSLWSPTADAGGFYQSNNLYFNGTNRLYLTTNFATEYVQASGQHIWKTAPSGTAGATITLTQAMTLDASGNLGIGTTSPSASAILDAQSTTKGVRMPNMTTTQKNAIASPAAGLMVFDTTLAKLCVYSGAAWQTITSI